ncbi:MAG: chlorite dismutase family protein [Terrimicrobiaceae bacterium]
MPTVNEPILLREGRHVLHLFLSIEYGQWDLLDPRSKIEAKTAMASLVQEIRAEPDTQLLTFSVVTPKADLGFLLVTPDLHVADGFTKRLAQSLGPDILSPEFAYLSTTEVGEYESANFGDAANLKNEADREQRQKDKKDLLEPELPDWPVICFYPISMRRSEGLNWYALDFESRKQLMASHTKATASNNDLVRTLISGSTGLDDMEWAVTLFAHSTSSIKDKVHQMRFEEIDAKYREFGAFFIGLQLPLDALFERLGL